MMNNSSSKDHFLKNRSTIQVAVSLPAELKNSLRKDHFLQNRSTIQVAITLPAEMKNNSSNKDHIL